MRRFFALLACCYLLRVAPALADSPPTPRLLAAVASVDITPEPGLRLWGYSNRTGGATGTLDPLLAKVLVLDCDGLRVAIVTLDLGRTPDEAQLAELRDRTAKVCGVSPLFVTASHTHQAPNIEPYEARANRYVESLIDKLAQAVCAAAGRLVPVTLRVGGGEVDLAHNRRRFLPDGRVAMQWRNAERGPNRPVDRHVTVLRFDRADGTALAVAAHYACHPVVLGPDNYRYSADYVGAARELVERELKADFLFLQGACGDINPYMDKTPLADGGVAEMQKMGQTLGQAVVETVNALGSQPDVAASLKYVSQQVPIRVRWDVNNAEVRSILSQAYGPRFDAYLAPRLKEGVLSLTLSTLVVNDRVALIGMPGEVFQQFQFDLQQGAPRPHTLLVGYTHGYHAYFPTIRDAAAGGYGGKTATYVDVGTGEQLTAAALITLWRLEGKLEPVPRQEDFQLLEWDSLQDAVSPSR